MHLEKELFRLKFQLNIGNGYPYYIQIQFSKIYLINKIDKIHIVKNVLSNYDFSIAYNRNFNHIQLIVN